MSEALKEPGTGSVPADTGATQVAVRADALAPHWLALRDVAIGAAVLSLFAAADAWDAIGGFALSGALSVVDGLLVGAAISALAHEWGHFAAARLSGAMAPTLPLSAFPRLFDFDFDRSDARQFQAMSIGGNAAHWTTLALLAATLPLDAAGRVALVAGSFGFCVFASTTELPVIARVRRGVAPRSALTGVRRVLARNARMALAAALVLFLSL